MIKDEAVSSEHASVYFIKGAWKVRDLASRNGTFVNGRAIEPGAPVQLEEGDQLAFGSVELPWVFEDSAEPGPSALSTSGERIWGETQTLWIPDADEPQVCVRMGGEGWALEDVDGSRGVKDGHSLEVNSETWELELPEQILADTEIRTASTTMRADQESLELFFRVASDEEHVSLGAKYQGQEFQLGARSYNYCLLILARDRLQAATEQVAAGEAGWRYVDELCEALHLDRKAFNLLVWRAKQSFDKAGLPGDQLLERRPDSAQIRIGVDRCLIQSA